MSGVSDEVFVFVERCQSVIGAWQYGLTVDGLSSVWACLAHAPTPRSFEDCVTLSSTVLRLAVGVLERTTPRTGPHDPLLAFRVVAPLTRRASPQARVSQLLTLLGQRYREPELTLAALAGSLGLSHAYLSHAIHRQTGQRFCTHLNGFRLLATIVMLRTTTLSIKEIAAAAGYNRTSALDRQCQRWLHMTPNRVRCAVQGSVDEVRKLSPHVRTSVGLWRAQPGEIADALNMDLGLVLRLRGLSSRLVGQKSR